MTAAIHPALLDFSYSSTLLEHTCPRKLELEKCSPRAEVENTNVDFAFGHSLGEGIQQLFCGVTMQQAIWRASLAWDCPLFSCIEKKKKSFWHVIFALKQFEAIAASYLREWRVAEFNGKPAVELSFRLLLRDGFRYRGHVDVVLIHRITCELMVVELKTTGSSIVAEAEYRNSGQGIGYSIILDAVAKQETQLAMTSSFKVLYLVYSTTAQEYTPLPYPKSSSNKARWLAQLMIHPARIQMYAEFGLFPIHGESCNDYWRPCKYLGICELSNASLGLVKAEDFVPEDKKARFKPYTFEYTLEQLIAAQLA